MSQCAAIDQLSFRSLTFCGVLVYNAGGAPLAVEPTPFIASLSLVAHFAADGVGRSPCRYLRGLFLCTDAVASNSHN